MLLFIIIWKLVLFNKNIYLIIYSSFFIVAQILHLSCQFFQRY